jgi:hypothetical protein
MKVSMRGLPLVVQVALVLGTAEYFHDEVPNGKKLKVQPLRFNDGVADETFGLSEAHPGVAPGDLVSGALVTHWESQESLSLQLSYRYQLDRLIRIKGAKNFVERSRVSPIFFTPAIGHLELSAFPSNNLSIAKSESNNFEEEVVEGHDVGFPTSSARLHGSWCLRRRCNRGAHGEIWRATRISADSAEREYCVCVFYCVCNHSIFIV